MKFEDLSQWIENDDARYAVVQENNSRETFVKIPYDEDFDFIYHQRVSTGKNLSRTQAFYYCGVYNKLDGKLYDLQNPLKGNLSDLNSGKTIRTLQDEFEAAVRSFINNIVDNNVDNLRSPFFENESYQQKLDHFKEYYAEAVIRQKFLDGESAEEKEKVREWVRGQNSDGFGEGLEQRPIETEDGDLYVSMWNSGDDYFIYDENEMNNYLSQQQSGGMKL